MASQTDTMDNVCHFLRLSPELRNSIYELAFTGTDIPNVGINLLEASAPSNSLLLTCQEIYYEARGIYKHAYRDYWRLNAFVIYYKRRTRRHPDTYQSVLRLHRPEDIDEITNLHILQHPDEPVRNTRSSRQPNARDRHTMVSRYKGQGIWKREVFRSTLSSVPDCVCFLKAVLSDGVLKSVVKFEPFAFWPVPRHPLEELNPIIARAKREVEARAAQGDRFSLSEQLLRFSR